MRRCNWSAPTVLIPLLSILMVFAALVGPRGVDSTDLLRNLLARGASGWGFRVLLTLRVPRVLIAATTGAALSIAGVALQTWLRNPIADIGILGVSAWGALGAVLALYLGLGTITAWAQPLVATLVAFLALCVLLYATRREQAAERILLLGVGLGAVGSSLISLLLCWSLPDWKASRQIMAWLLGDLAGKTWVHVAAALPMAGCGMALLLLEHESFDALRLGHHEAASLGIDVPRLQRRIVIATGLLAGAAAAAAGVVGFVGIMVPYLVRRNSCLRHKEWFHSAALAGATLLVLADLIARRAPGNSELQVGVLTGLFGAPILLRQLLTQQEAH